MRGHWLVAVLLAASGTAAVETAPEGWFKAGEDPQDYEIGVARNVARSGKASSYLRSSVDEPETFGTLMQMCDAEGFIGKRIQMSGYVKTDGVEGWAGLWFRIDGVNKRPIGFDNMMNRPISGMSDWTRYTIVLDVPTDSNNLAFGVLLSGAGSSGWMT